MQTAADFSESGIARNRLQESQAFAMKAKKTTLALQSAI